MPIDSKVWHDAWVHIEGTQLPNGVEEDVRYDAEYLRGVFAGGVCGVKTNAPGKKWAVKNGGPAFNFLPPIFLSISRVR